MMGEQVLTTVFRGNKAETFLVVEPLDGANLCLHLYVLESKRVHAVQNAGCTVEYGGPILFEALLIISRIDHLTKIK